MLPEVKPALKSKAIYGKATAWTAKSSCGLYSVTWAASGLELMFGLKLMPFNETLRCARIDF